jgi:hypothetical protein
VPTPEFYIRCRLAAGRPDAPPQLIGAFADAVRVEQWDDTATLLRKTVPPSAKTVTPELSDLQLTPKQSFDLDDTYRDLLVRGWAGIPPWSAWPTVRAPVHIESRPSVKVPRAPDPSVGFVVLGLGTGAPGQSFDLPCPTDRTRLYGSPDDPNLEQPRVVTSALRVWTVEPSWAWEPPGPSGTNWNQVEWHALPDLVLAARTTPAYVFDPDRIQIRFGTGEHGRVPPQGAVVAASYQWTFAESANAPVGTVWGRLADADPYRPYETPVPFRSVLPITSGAPAEDLPRGLFRLEDDVTSGELLVNPTGVQDVGTLDGVALPALAPARPALAVAPPDFEYLALTVPGRVVKRARAWADVDPRFPGFAAPGAVTVVVVPALPADQPRPTPELLRAVAADLAGRRPVACRVSVIGPDYQTVAVKATLSVGAGQGPTVRARAVQALQDFLHPLRGGAGKRGWPFGRSVYPGELLQALGAVDGVAHVTGLQLSDGSGTWGEDPITLTPRALVALAPPQLDTREDA